jgi:hypothetical protein
MWVDVADALPSDCLQHRGSADSESFLSGWRGAACWADARLRLGEVDAGVFEHNHVEPAV